MSILGAVVVPHPPIILPAVGRGEERKIQSTIDAYRKAMDCLAALRPDTVVLLSPHATMYADWFHISPGAGAKGDLSQFGAPMVRTEISYDEEFADALSCLCMEKGVPAGTQGEKSSALDHASVIPLCFLHETGLRCSVVRIGLSGLPAAAHYGLGKCITETADRLSRRTAIIASGDLSHRLTEDSPYGFAPEGPEFDRRVTEALKSGDFGALLRFTPEFCDAAGECGLRAFQIMAGAFDGVTVQSELLSYEGPFGVGYGIAVLTPDGRDGRRYFGAVPEQQREETEPRKSAGDPCVRLARLSLETFVRTGEWAVLPGDLPAELLEQKAGAFVSLKKAAACAAVLEPLSPRGLRWHRKFCIMPCPPVPRTHASRR